VIDYERRTKLFSIRIPRKYFLLVGGSHLDLSPMMGDGYDLRNEMSADLHDFGSPIQLVYHSHTTRARDREVRMRIGEKGMGANYKLDQNRGS